MNTRKDDTDWVFRVAPFVTGAVAGALLVLGVLSLGTGRDPVVAALCFVFGGLFGFLTVGNVVLLGHWTKNGDESPP